MYTPESREDSILYAPFHPARHPQLLPKVVDCYRQVFAQEPWNEWKKCPKCGRKWGTVSATDLESTNYTHCGMSVVDYWPEEVVRDDIVHEITEEASCWLALTKERGVIGFAWGYPISPENLAVKLGKEEVATQIKLRFGDHALVAYQDELAVVTEFRGRKVAKTLAALRLRDMKMRGVGVGVVRTKMNPPSVTYLWFVRDGYQTISEYGDADQRVVLARSYDGYDLTTDQVKHLATSGL